MATHEGLSVRHALAVLKEYAEPRNCETPRPAVQLALRALSPYVDRYELGCFLRIATGIRGINTRGLLLSQLEVIERRARLAAAAGTKEARLG